MITKVANIINISKQSNYIIPYYLHIHTHLHNTTTAHPHTCYVKMSNIITFIKHKIGIHNNFLRPRAPLLQRIVVSLKEFFLTMNTTDKNIFSLEIEVRDYEIDSEGIVNNANYQHYLEHTRHKFCQEAGLSFKQMQEKGLIPVVNRVEIDYVTPLRSDDVMISSLWVELKGVRFIFHQTITNKVSGDIAVKAIVSCVCLENGKLSRGEAFREAFKNYL